ncbi:MAG: PTS sugar transporter subunit IIA [Kiritimatiellae bacterium]|nr:PTS sugar transporter subunit IIA [Kiritimatiellia bacterium]
MHSIINQLIQLQELTLIRDEQKIAYGSARFEELDTSIKTMASGLIPEHRTMFEKLHKKDHNVIVPISDGICSVCGLKLPISLVQAVRLAKALHNCPNCARILYYPEAAPRHVRGAPRRSEPRKPGIQRFSAQSLMVPNIESANPEGAIRELAYKMESEGFVDKADKLVERALQREFIFSTAVDHGIAFPHVRGVEGGSLTLSLGISKKGIKFTQNGDDEKSLTKIIFFIVIPTAASAFYLKLLAGLAEAFMKVEVRKAIIAEKDQEGLWKALIKATRITVK